MRRFTTALGILWVGLFAWLTVAWADNLTVTASRANVRQGPGLTHGVIDTLPRGATFPVLKTQDGWHQIQQAAASPSAPTVLAADDGDSDRVRAEQLATERVFWQSIEASTNPDDFAAYLAQYPDGTFKTLARNRMRELVFKPGTVFRDCGECPQMVVVPAGSFRMGSPSGEAERGDDEGPVHRVTFDRPFAVGVYEVTFREWDACVAGGGCNGYRPDDRGWGRGDRPVINVSWDDARAYVRWLSRETGEGYRLLSESEWEYVARAGTTGPFHTGATISTDQANYNGNYVYGSGRRGVWREQTVVVGRFPPNGFGLHDVHGNVWEWVQDCWHDDYVGAPSDGGAWETGDCIWRVARDGSWIYGPRYLRAALRNRYTTGDRDDDLGFRIARTLTP